MSHERVRIGAPAAEFRQRDRTSCAAIFSSPKKTVNPYSGASRPSKICRKSSARALPPEHPDAAGRRGPTPRLSTGAMAKPATSSRKRRWGFSKPTGREVLESVKNRPPRSAPSSPSSRRRGSSSTGLSSAVPGSLSPGKCSRNSPCYVSSLWVRVQRARVRPRKRQEEGRGSAAFRPSPGQSWRRNGQSRARFQAGAVGRAPRDARGVQVAVSRRPPGVGQAPGRGRSKRC